MIDLGKVVDSILMAASTAVEYQEGEITALGERWWPCNTTTEPYVEKWEKTLGIAPIPGALITDRRTAILLKLRSSGGLNKQTFYEIAGVLGWKPPFNFIINDGEIKPFRVGLSGIGELFYDNTTNTPLNWRVMFASRGNALNESMKAMMIDLRPVCTAVDFDEQPIGWTL